MHDKLGELDRINDNLIASMFTLIIGNETVCEKCGNWVRVADIKSMPMLQVYKTKSLKHSLNEHFVAEKCKPVDGGNGCSKCISSNKNISFWGSPLVD